MKIVQTLLRWFELCVCLKVEKVLVKGQLLIVFEVVLWLLWE